MLLFIEQLLNGLQLGIMLFLMSAGLTLVFGIMQVINLAHGSFYMIGAYVGATVTARSGSFVLGILAALPAAALAGMPVEALELRRLYKKDHLDQVLATFGLIMFFNELTRIIWGRQPLFMDVPSWLAGSIAIIPGVPYPSYRLAVIFVGVLVGVLLYLLFTRTRIGVHTGKCVVGNFGGTLHLFRGEGDGKFSLRRGAARLVTTAAEFSLIAVVVLPTPPF